jgi:hypothetical protein
VAYAHANAHGHTEYEITNSELDETDRHLYYSCYAPRRTASERIRW